MALSTYLPEKVIVAVFTAETDGTGFVCNSQLSNTAQYLLTNISTTSQGFEYPSIHVLLVVLSLIIFNYLKKWTF